MGEVLPVMKKVIYSKEIKVPDQAIDEVGHVNNVVYLEWILMISEEHWSHTIPENIRRQVMWVVLNHFIEYKNPAFKDEILLIQTWVEEMEGVKSKRRVEIRNKTTDKILVQATTLWCLIDGETKRPKRIMPEMSKDFFN